LTGILAELRGKTTRSVLSIIDLLKARNKDVCQASFNAICKLAGYGKIGLLYLLPISLTTILATLHDEILSGIPKMVEFLKHSDGNRYQWIVSSLSELAKHGKTVSFKLRFTDHDSS